MLDTIKAETLPYDIRTWLVIGETKTNKTGFLATFPRPMLVLAGEANSISRLSGQKDVEIIPCFDVKREGKATEVSGTGIARFKKTIKEIATTPNLPYKTIAIDPFSFLSNGLLMELQRINPQLKTTRGWEMSLYGLVMEEHLWVLNSLLPLSVDYYIVFTSHVENRKDDVTGREQLLADLNGKIRNAVGGYFQAVLYSEVENTATGVNYYLQAQPDSKKKCGVAVPIGLEATFGKKLPMDYKKIVGMLTSGKVTQTTS